MKIYNVKKYKALYLTVVTGLRLQYLYYNVPLLYLSTYRIRVMWRALAIYHYTYLIIFHYLIWFNNNILPAGLGEKRWKLDIGAESSKSTSIPDWRSRLLPTAASPAGDRVRPLGHQPRAGEAGDALHLGQRHGVWPRRRDRRRVHGGTSQEPKGKADCSGGKPAVPWHCPGETAY